MSKYPHFNRELSWLSFNYRVLQEVKDPNVPLHEKIKFMAIFSSNMDEFFRVRVASLRYLLELKRKTQSKLDVHPAKLLNKIQTMVDEQQQELGKIFRKKILPGLAENNIELVDGKSLNNNQTAFVKDFFKYEIQPLLRPSILIRNKMTIFLQNRVIYLTIRLVSKNNNKKTGKKTERSTYAILEIPTMFLPRFIEIPDNSNQQNHTIMFLDDIIRMFLPSIFHGYRIKEVYSVKLTRDAQMYIDDEFSGNLLEKIKEGITRRKTGVPSRFLYDGNMSPPFLQFLRDAFLLRKEDLIPGGRYHNFNDFISFPRLGPASLQDNRWIPLPLKILENSDNILSIIQKKDLLLFYPYHTYDYVIRFLKEAADDSHTIAVQITLYRSAPDSEVIHQLIQAAQSGKKVTVFIEVKARFDEESNLVWAQKLEKSGIDVLYSFPGLKVHSKICLITRRENKRLVRYAYLSTGNFNEKTAKVYSDFGLFTADHKITQEIKHVFDSLNNQERNRQFRHLLVAPRNMRRKFNDLIEKETENARNQKEARIDIKLNSLEDKKIIEKLYQASEAGVKIRIIVRGICCLVPGIKDISENIEVISIIDKFLEHARIYIFHNGGSEKYYLASADWMQRNLSRRIEVGFPIYDQRIKEQIKKIFEIQWQDNVKARLIDRSQMNRYVDVGSKTKIRSQMAIYQYLKNEM